MPPRKHKQSKTEDESTRVGDSETGSGAPQAIEEVSAEFEKHETKEKGEEQGEVQLTPLQTQILKFNPNTALVSRFEKTSMYMLTLQVNSLREQLQQEEVTQQQVEQEVYQNLWNIKKLEACEDYQIKAEPEQADSLRLLPVPSQFLARIRKEERPVRKEKSSKYKSVRLKPVQAKSKNTHNLYALSRLNYRENYRKAYAYYFAARSAMEILAADDEERFKNALHECPWKEDGPAELKQVFIANMRKYRQIVEQMCEHIPDLQAEMQKIESQIETLETQTTDNPRFPEHKKSIAQSALNAIGKCLEEERLFRLDPPSNSKTPHPSPKAEKKIKSPLKPVGRRGRKKSLKNQ